LATHRQSLAVAQAPVTAKVHQPLDVHRHLAAQIALDLETLIDDLAHPYDFVVGELIDPPFGGNGRPIANCLGLGPADTVNVGQRDLYPLPRGNIYACDTRHVSLSSLKPIDWKLAQAIQA
jgi:hypothetical protein